MKTGNRTAQSSPTSEVKSRKTLHNLQPTATDKENLVSAGRVLRSSGPVKPEMPETTPKISPPNKEQSRATRKTITKTVSPPSTKGKTRAAKSKPQVRVEDLTTETGDLSADYWQTLAEERGRNLKEALDENKKLHKRVEKLEAENNQYQVWLTDAKSVIETLQEMLGEDGSGIDHSLDDSRL